MSVPRNILIVDDEADIAEVLASIVSAPGRSFEVVGNGKLALDALERRPFDVVVSDFSMPVMDGITLYEHARALGLTVPFIFLSGNYDFSLRQDQFAAAGVYVFAKTQFADLRDKVTALTAAPVVPQADGSDLAPILHALRRIHRGH